MSDNTLIFFILLAELGTGAMYLHGLWVAFGHGALVFVACFMVPPMSVLLSGATLLGAI